jgi:DNA-binding transcriptional MerR regulator
MPKAVDAFRSISEVADELGIPKHVLRFWEGRFNQLKPMQRGGGRRLYRPEDVALLRGIQHLLHVEGYTIKGVQKLIRLSGVDFVKGQGQAGAIMVSAPAAPIKRKSRAATATPESLTPSASAARAQVAALSEVLRELEVCRKLLSEVSGS